MIDKNILLGSDKYAKNLFFTKDFKTIFNPLEKINLILSPEFYWTRKIHLPVTKEKEANKLLKHYFEEILGDISGFRFVAKEIQTNEYLAFAYNPTKIIEALSEKNIQYKLIQNIYFATIECKDFEAFSIGDQMFYYHEDVLVCMPKNLFYSPDIAPSAIDFDSLKLSRYTANLHTQSRWMSATNQLFASAILGFCGICFFALGWMQSAKIKTTNEQMQKLQTSYNLPPTKLQLSSEVMELEDTFKTQNHLRSALEYILSFKNTLSDGKIIHLSYEKKSFFVTFVGLDEQSLRGYFQKEFKNVRVIQGDGENQYLVELGL